jgi:tetratricopeptide (TPR) repeat protein
MSNKNTASATTDTTEKHTNAGSLRRPNVRMVQNFLVVWLDENIDENDDDYQHSIVKLREVSNTVNTFTDVDECISFIMDIKTKKVFMISSGAFGQTTVPLVHDMTQIDTIYIFCGDKVRHQKWAQQWSKIQDVFTDITSICEVLKKAVHKCDQNTISMSFVSTSDGAIGKNLNQLDQSFMYTQILKEILLTIDFEQKHFMEFITYCHEQFKGNPAELKNVDKLEKEYRGHTPIWWYTYHCFLYSMLNCALRTMEVDLIIKLGFFIRDLHEHITRLHSEQYPKDHHSDSFVVYRGQGLSETDFNQLMRTKGGLLSFNNFLSTSISREVSFAFAESNHYDPNLIGVLFQITISSSTACTTFANSLGVSYYEGEREILFSMHSIFRIGQIKQIDGNNRLWQVDLILTSDLDRQLHALTEHIRKETFPHMKGWYRLGQLLMKLGQFDKAQEVYEAMLAQTTDDREEASIYHQLGWIKNNQEEYADAIRFYEKSIEINEKTLPPNHPDLATSYGNIGSVYDNMGEYSKALSFHEKSIEIYEKTLPPNHPHLATSYSNIGRVYDNMGEYSKAFSFQEKAFEIREKTLPPNHPHLATSYSNIGRVYDNMGEYSKAFSFHEKALEIDEKTLLPNHPNLAISYSNIGSVYDKMGEYSKALSFHEKALEIDEKTLLPNHPNLAISYSNIGSVYDKMGEYSKALSFHEKVLEIEEKTLPPNHPDLAVSYNNIGGVYDEMGDYSKVLSFYEKALEIREKTLPPNHPHLATSYSNIGSVYDKMGEYSKALSFYQHALDIGQDSLPTNHPDLHFYTNNVKSIKKKL